jgi:hypothetical protein
MESLRFDLTPFETGCKATEDGGTCSYELSVCNISRNATACDHNVDTSVLLGRGALGARFNISTSSTSLIFTLSGADDMIIEDESSASIYVAFDGTTNGRLLNLSLSCTDDYARTGQRSFDVNSSVVVYRESKLQPRIPRSGALGAESFFNSSNSFVLLVQESM